MELRLVEDTRTTARPNDLRSEHSANIALAASRTQGTPDYFTYMTRKLDRKRKK